MPFKEFVLNQLRNKPIYYALLLFVGGLLILAIFLDFLVMPLIAGSFASRAEVPVVEGLSAAEAEKKLDEAGFRFQWTTDGRYSATIPAGKVVIQIPVAGREAKLGRTVLLTLSQGLREIVVPDLRGKSLHQAEISLMRAGLTQGKLIQGAHGSIPRGVVIRTEPAAGRSVRIGDSVRVVISSGASAGKVMLPSFTKQSVEDAIQKLESLGFVVGDVRREAIPEGIPGTVATQSPEAGEYLSSGSKIDLVVVD